MIKYRLTAFLKAMYRFDKEGPKTEIPFTTGEEHEHGVYDTQDEARWWAVNTRGLWVQNNEDLRFYPRDNVGYFSITEVEVE